MKKQTTFLLALSVVLLAIAGLAQDAVVVLKPNTRVANPCVDKVELRWLVVRDPKIGGKGDVRLAGELGTPSPSTAVARDRFGRLRKVRMRDLGEIEVRNGLLFASTGQGEKSLLIPDVEPAKSSAMSLGQYASMSLEGESRDGRSKQKQVIPLNTISRMFLLSGGTTVEEALFRHAQQEATVSTWTAYLEKVQNYRSGDASTEMAKASGGCLQRAVDQFRGGDFRAIEEAKKLATVIAGMPGASQSDAEKPKALEQEEQQVRSQMEAGANLEKQQKWDEALTAWEPVQKYRKDSSLNEFAASYDRALTSSHEQHFKAATALAQDQAANRAALKKAQDEFELALRRRPDSPAATQGRRDAIIRMAVIDGKQFRTAREPAKAREILLKVSEEHGEDARLAGELKEASCEYGQQLFDQARNLVTAISPAAKAGGATKSSAKAPAGKTGAAKAPGAAKKAPPAIVQDTAAGKPIIRSIQSVAEKRQFADAHGKLVLATQLCASEDKTQLQSAVNEKIADYHVGEAAKAGKNKYPATALLHLRAAQAYEPEREGLESLLATAREPVQQKAQIHAGVVIKSPSRQCSDLAQQLETTIESAITGGGIANVQLLGRDEADGILRRLRSGGRAGLPPNYAILSGQLDVCGVSDNAVTKNVPSKYNVPNETYKQLQLQISDYDRQVDECVANCRRTPGCVDRQQCLGLRNRRQQIKDQQSQQQPTNSLDYYYTERAISVSGQMHLTLTIDDAILEGTRRVGEPSASVNESCVERSNVKEEDSRKYSGVADKACPGFDRATKTAQMSEKLLAETQQQAAAAFRGVAKGYLEKATKATNEDLALENYIAFALLSADKSAPDYQRALAAIQSRDADLKPEAALR